MRSVTLQNMDVGGRRLDYRVVGSRSARRLRIRVGLDGVEVVRPIEREAGDVTRFMDDHRGWIAEQVDRVERLRAMRAPRMDKTGEMLFRGTPTDVQVVSVPGRKGRNGVCLDAGVLRVVTGGAGGTSAARSLENWLRKQARTAIAEQLGRILPKLRHTPNRVYVMGQRTKWGNCSKLKNLSFSWRLIMAPDHVLRYLVAHEAVHLAVPDHSARFWLTVQSLCPETERARQWLNRYGKDLPLTLESVVSASRKT